MNGELRLIPLIISLKLNHVTITGILDDHLIK